MKISKLKEVYGTIVLYSLNGLCLIFVISNTIQSVTRFTERPQGTVVSMKKSAGLPFPAITICPNFGKYTLKVGNNSREMERIFNVTYLEKICGIR